LIALPFGGLSLDQRNFGGFVQVLVGLGVLFFWGRRKQKAARARQLAARG
jgi:hypothetical protein